MIQMPTARKARKKIQTRPAEMKLYAQVNFGGNCEEAFRFYAKHLGGKITFMMKRREAPAPDPAPAGAQDAIIHARMTVGQTELIGNDVPAEIFQPMRSAYLYLNVGSTQDAERIYGALTEGGQVFMPLAATFFATRFAMLRDRFGISWAIVHERPRQRQRPS
jgi:PhnB protein